jgi:hydroxyacylglutathione hydrolase
VSYVVGCPRTRRALVVDPIADVGCDAYARAVARRGLAPAAVVETHVHSDFVSCARELAERYGVPHHLHAKALRRAGYDFAALVDGQRLELGDVEARVVHTPGHTPEHICLVIAEDGHPRCVLTGDSLGVGTVARPDLLVGPQVGDVRSEVERAAILYWSIRDRLLTLPDDVTVWPGHCDDGAMSTTIGAERRANPAMRLPDDRRFARLVADSRRGAPAGQRAIKLTNLGLGR